MTRLSDSLPGSHFFPCPVSPAFCPPTSCTRATFKGVPVGTVKGIRLGAGWEGIALLLAGAGCSGRRVKVCPPAQFHGKARRTPQWRRPTHKLIPSIGGEGRSGEEVQCM